jgi:hypothetical protein
MVPGQSAGIKHGKDQNCKIYPCKSLKFLIKGNPWWKFACHNKRKFSGLQLESQLSWKPHINFLLHKMSSICFMMRSSSPIHKIQTLRTADFAHFHSLVKSGLIFWSNTSSMHKVFLIQKDIKNYVEIKFLEFLKKMV